MKKTLSLGMVAQAYVSLIGLILMPYYMQLMGAEAFGLVGFYILLQASLPIFELGFTQSLSREMSRWRAAVLSNSDAWSRLRSLEVMLCGLALIAILAISGGSGWISHVWLKISQLSDHEVASSLVAMAISVGVRWFASLYRASLIGMERQQLVYGVNVALATLRFVGVLPLLIYVSARPTAFFSFQAAMAAIELLLFRIAMYRALPDRPAHLRPSWKALRAMWPLAGSMAFLGTISIAITQVDKLILSKTLSLEAYGYFTLATVVASAVLVLMPPLSQVLQPRLTILVERRNFEQLHELYRLSSQFGTALYVSIGATLAVFAEPLLWAWTGDPVATRMAAPILVWYAVANSLLAILSLPFMLQFAFGHLQLHVIGQILMVVILLPLLVYAAVNYGAVGVGMALVFARILYMVLWVPLVYARLIQSITLSWYIRDIGTVAVSTIIAIFSLFYLMPMLDNRVLNLIMIAAALGLSLVAGILSGTQSRSNFLRMVKI